MMSTNTPHSPLLQAARMASADYYRRRADNRLVFHTYARTNQLVSQVELLGQSLAPDSQLAAQLAAWWAYTGFATRPEQPWVAATQLAKDWLREQAADEHTILAVSEAIQALERPSANGAVAQLLQDAHQVVMHLPDDIDELALFRLQQELLLDQRYSNSQWQQARLQALMGVKFNLPQSRLAYDRRLAERIMQRHQQVEKLNQQGGDLPEETGLSQRVFDNIERKVPLRAIQTFFRTNYRNHINLSAIADNKANIMISVNSILISVLITAVSYQNIDQTNPKVLLPVVLFLVTGTASLFFAILSSRPKVTNVLGDHPDTGQTRRNIIFFGNFAQLDLDQYEQAMDAMFRDGELLYGNMTRDMYYLGQVLAKKYRFLTISYTLFTVGLLATVLTFLWALFS